MPDVTNSPSKKRRTLAGIMFGVLAFVVSFSAEPILLPVAAKEFGAFEYYPLARNAGAVLAIFLTPIVGFFCSRRPPLRRSLYCACMFSATAGLAVMAVSLNFSMLTIGILLSRLYVPALYVCGYVMIRDMYDTKAAGIYIGWTSTVMMFGVLFAPTLAGLVIHYVSWRVLCWGVVVPMLVPSLLVLSGFRYPPYTGEAATKGSAPDILGIAGIALVATGLVGSLSLGRTLVPFGTPLNFAFIVGGVTGVVLLGVSMQRNSTNAVIPPVVLRDRNVLCLCISDLISSAVGMAFFYFLPAYVLYVMHGTAVEATIPISLLSVLGLFLGPLFGKMIGRSGNVRTVAIIGSVAQLGVVVFLGFVLAPTSPMWLLYATMLVGGIDSSSRSVAFPAGPQVQLRREIRVMGCSVIQVAHNMGSLIGASVMTLLMSTYGLGDSFRMAFQAAVLLQVVVLVCLLPLRSLAQQGLQSPGLADSGTTFRG